MDEVKFRQIIEKCRKGVATPSEKKAIEAFFESYIKEAKDWPYDIMGSPEESERIIFEQIRAKQELSAEPSYRTDRDIYPPQLHRRRLSIPTLTLWKMAATFLILLLAGYGAYIYKFQEPATPVISDIAPGGDKAILQLADGTQIDLDSTGTVVIPQQGTARVINESGKLAYVPADGKVEAGEATGTVEEILYNTITTPRGGQYRLTLSDGSGVWLNAESSLRFPAAFTGIERIVELTGEAYFEIAKNENMPFRVRIPSGAEVEVLGTHFNIMAYEEESAIKTTLLEGSVKLYSGSGAQVTSVRLEPSQQAQLSADGEITIIKDYDVTEAVAWKNGMFVFNDTELEAIMRQVSRWYDVEVTYKDDLRALEFGGVVSRRENAPAVLNLLKLTGEVDFEIQGREILVKSVKK